MYKGMKGTLTMKETLPIYAYERYIWRRHRWNRTFDGGDGSVFASREKSPCPIAFVGVSSSEGTDDDGEGSGKGTSVSQS
jgi:hypothetical protein